MKEHVVKNNPKMKSRGLMKESSPKEMICFLLKEMGCESIQEITCSTDVEGIQSFQTDVGNETISMFLVKDEKEFLSVLGLGEEVFHV